ncbi:MAG: ABC transporter ATP-binding protein [Ardenticatenia bacterium]|nr:ABC transporter ATP-binding protein [Ardenticatenia bacterium]
MAVVEAVGLTKRFGTITAVENVSFHVREGEVLALLGPNGAGKTTTVRCLAAILRPTSGYALVAGHDTRTAPRRVRHLVGLLTEFPGLYGRMKPLEYLDFFGAMQGLDAHTRRARAETLLKQFNLWHARRQRLGQFSKGMRQKMALVRALLHAPKVLFLDEPTAALDPEGAYQVRQAIADLRRRGHTILLCTHNLVEAETLADRLLIIHRGRILARGTIEELKAHVLGDPVFRVQLAQPLEGLPDLLGDVVSPLEWGPDWISYRTRTPTQTNPAVISRLQAAGGHIVTLVEEPRRLEDVYLRLMGAVP